MRARGRRLEVALLRRARVGVEEDEGAEQVQEGGRGRPFFARATAERTTSPIPVLQVRECTLHACIYIAHGVYPARPLLTGRRRAASAGRG